MINEKYKLSVIIPVYNAEKYLKNCLESILNQTYKNLEIILINDCSTDDSLEVCKMYKEKDDRIILINNDVNKGQAATRNRGVKEATGDFITFVDNDDTIEKNMYETLINDAITYSSQVTGCACLLVFDDGKIINNYRNSKSGLKNNKELIKKILMHSDDAWGTVWNKIFSKELKEYLIFPEGKELEDYYVLIKMYTNVNKIYFNNTPMYLWYQRPSSQSKRGYHKNIRTLIDVSLEIKKMLNYEEFEKELVFFEFVNRYHVITATFKSKKTELYKELYNDITEIEKLNKKVSSVKSKNRNIKKMIFNIKIIKLFLMFYRY